MKRRRLLFLGAAAMGLATLPPFMRDGHFEVPAAAAAAAPAVPAGQRFIPVPPDAVPKNLVRKTFFDFGPIPGREAQYAQAKARIEANAARYRDRSAAQPAAPSPAPKKP
jgi:hypothetical protein